MSVQTRTGRAVAVVVPDLAHLTQAACLTGADLPTAQRFLRARALTVQAGWRDRNGTGSGGTR